MRQCRQIGLLLCFAGFLSVRAQSPLLSVERRDNYLHVAAPQLHFLEGKSLDQLQNGASVAYVFELTLTSDQKIIARSQQRFILSFDLWEEKFSVVQAGAHGRSRSHLTAPMAEAWCLDSLQIPIPALSPERSFVIKLDCRATMNVDESNEDSSPGLSLAGLIDALSRKGRDAPPRWQAFSNPLRFADLAGNKK
ncbi:MAG TPA: hypothetical protein VE398_23025 [Acidobacteriota bacterium]|nr:hypothetical protein [Acidobacteriota bacterium]